MGLKSHLLSRTESVRIDRSADGAGATGGWVPALVASGDRLGLQMVR